MTATRLSLLALVALSFGPATPASALIAGGGPKRSDCYAEWQVTTPELTATKGAVGVDCQDGDPRCDVDGQRDGMCTFGVSICVFQSDVPGCTPQEVTAIKLRGKAQPLGVQIPPLPASAPACGPAALISLPLRSGRRGSKPSKPLRLKMIATSSGRPKKDVDQLVLRCVPNAGAAQCPANASGGARELSMTVGQEGTDLDNGWTGGSHNFPVVFGTQLRMCLTGCDASTNFACAEDEPSTEQVNGRTFGPPLPLLAAVPVCLVNRFATPKLTGGTANIQTGAVSATMNLLTDVFLTPATQICPRCSGNDIGKTGTCDIGARQGQACKTEGTITVPTAPGNKFFTLSSDCPPDGSPAGTVTITLPLTTGTSTPLQGPRPCGASQDDLCGSGTCTATCTGQACSSTNSQGQCIDSKGGLSQLCCSSNTSTPCFPTAGGGQIVRAGAPGQPTPAWPEPTYPKSGTDVLVATFCEPATGSTAVDGVTGLPGPGALILPVSAQWIR